MTTQGELGNSAARVQRALAACGLELQVVRMPAATRTAGQAAAAVGCDVAQIAKSIVFGAAHSGRHVLVVTSGANRVDTTKVEALLGEPLRKADAAFVREKTGYAIGGVPPLAHVQEPVTFLDRDIFQHHIVWAAAGTPDTLFSLTPEQLAQVCAGTVADVGVDR